MNFEETSVAALPATNFATTMNTLYVHFRAGIRNAQAKQEQHADASSTLAHNVSHRWGRGVAVKNYYS